MPISVDRVAAGPLLPSRYSRPGQLNQEYFVDEVLLTANTPAEVILQRRPPVPETLLPPRFGYLNVQPTINDVLFTDRFSPRVRSWQQGAVRMPYQRVAETPSAEASTRNSIPSTAAVTM